MKRIFRILDNLSPSEAKLTNIARKANGLNNLYFNEYGQLVKRKGYLKYNTTTIDADHKIVGLHRFYKQDADTKEFLVACNTKWYKLASTSPYGATALDSKSSTDFTTTADMDTYWINFYDSCYGVNSKGLWKYDGTYVRTVGVEVPAKPANISHAATGSLSAGDYKVKFTYVDEDGYEGNGSTASDAETVEANDKITVTLVASTDDKIDYINIYRTSVNGALYYYDKQVANSAGTTDLTQADTTLSQGTVLHTNHNAPPSTPHLIAKKRTRVMIADAGKFYWSHAGDAEYFPAAWYIYTNARQKVTGLIEQKEWLSVFTSDTIERLTGQDEGNFEFKNTYSGEGNIALRSLVSCNNLDVYLGVDGIYYFDGNISKILNIPLSEYIKENINEEFAYLSCATFYNNKYLLSYPKGSSEVPNETVYIDFRTGVTGIYNFGFGCYCRWDRGTDGLQLYSGSTTEGRVYKTLSGLEDDGSAIACYDRTEPIDLGKPDIYKQFYDIYIKVKSTTGTALTMYYTLDDEDETSKSLTLTADTTAWYRVKLAQGGQRARSISLRPYISDKYDCEIHGYGLVYEEEDALWLK